MRVIVGLLLVVTTYAATCYTQGNTGTLNNLIQNVVVVFNGTVTSTYTSNELTAAFSVKFSSGRPLIINTTSVVGSNITLTFLQTATDFEAQTGASLSVNYTDLADVSGTLTVGGVPLVTGQQCASTVDTVGPVLMAAHTQTISGPNAALFFSEPVQNCGVGNPSLTSFPRVGVTTLATELTPQGSAPSTVWYFPASSVSGGATITLNVGGVCDAAGNAALSGTRSFASSSRRFAAAPPFQAGSFKYYDLNNNGQVDAMLFVASFAFNNTAFPDDPVPVQVNGVNVGNPSIVSEGLATDNSVLITFDDTALTGAVASISTTPTTFFGPNLTCQAGFNQTAVDLAPPVILTATSNFGLARVQLTVSESHSFSLACSQFRTAGIDLAGTQLWSNAVTIDCMLTKHLTNLTQIASARAYLALQAYGATENQGLPLWKSVSLNLDRIAFAYIATETTGEAWNLLIVNFTSTATSSTVVLDSLAAHQYAVTSETLLGSSAIYKISRTCVASTPCLTTNVDATYNLSSSLFNLSMVDLSPPVIVGYSVIVGSNKIRVQFSETVTLGHTAPFEIHSNGLLATSYTQTGSVFVFTLERAVKASDSSTGWNSLTATDSAGNTATATVPAVFTIEVTAFTDKLRITTNLPHQSINASMLSTVPLIELGDATRVSDTITDIEATVTSSSVTIEHVGGILLSSGQRSGFELLRAEFPVTGEVEPSSTSSGLSYGLAGGLIAGAAVAGGLIAWLWTRASNVGKRKYRPVVEF